MSSASMPFAHVTGKSSKDVNPSCASDSGEAWVHVTLGPAEVLPMCPISEADFLSRIQDPIGCVLPRRVEQTSEVSFVCSRSSSHDLSCCKGKSELNLVRKALSLRS